LFPPVATVTPQPFNTIQDYRAAAPSLAVQLHDLNLLAGVGTDAQGNIDYALASPLTRMQAITLVIRLMGLEQQADAYAGDNPFTDVPDWGSPIAAYAYSEGITAGVNSGHTLFDPDSPVTYREFTAFLLRVLGYSENNGDFTFDQTLSKAVNISLYTPSEETLTGDVTVYTRADAVISMVNALLTDQNGTGGRLIDKLVSDGVIRRDAADTFVTAVNKILGR
jgi:hypothetical protein